MPMGRAGFSLRRSPSEALGSDIQDSFVEEIEDLPQALRYHPRYY